MNVGIDVIEFATSRYFFSLKSLAERRNVEYSKYYLGIGQVLMSVFPPNEDIVTLAVAAAEKTMAKIEDKDSVDMLIFATESSFDISKAAGTYVHRFLGLKNQCRVFDIKQACYSGTAALQLAKNYVIANPKSKVLVVSSDILQYSSDTSGEPTQGGAAVAFIVSQNPRLLNIEPVSSVYSEEIMDFWRPIDKKEAIFDGKLSAYQYLRSLDIVFNDYLKQSGLSKTDIDYFCFHSPFGKMVRKAAKQIGYTDIENLLKYNSVIGNSCSASLYVGFISLLDHQAEDMSEKRIGFYSYGSGSVAEFFTGRMAPGYQKMLSSESNKTFLANRMEISFEEYETFRKFASDYKRYENAGSLKLTGVIDDKRIYKKI